MAGRARRRGRRQLSRPRPGLARLLVVIEDDGVGFDYESVLVEALGRMGLIGIRERAQSIGGQIEIESALGQGTRLTLEAPLPAGPTLEANDG